jgi:uncharacterized protein (TIGR02118 family)
LKPGSVINVVGVSHRPDQIEKLNRWYTEKHVPDLMKFPGLKRATWLKALNPETGSPMYLLISEFDSQEDYEAYEKSQELADSRKDAAQTWGKDLFQRIWRVQFKALKHWEK